MKREQKEYLIGKKWRELLKSLDYGVEKFPVSSVGEIKSLRTVASDFNTDGGIADKYIVNADRDLMMVTVTKAHK